MEGPPFECEVNTTMIQCPNDTDTRYIEWGNYIINYNQSLIEGNFMKAWNKFGKVNISCSLNWNQLKGNTLKKQDYNLINIRENIFTERQQTTMRYYFFSGRT